MNDRDCVEFLQWALPRLRLRWPGFRRVRRQVCKRLRRRMSMLGVGSLAGYRLCLDDDPAEWAVLDGLCRIGISRFYRDRRVFDFLRKTVLPALASSARRRGAPGLRVWSAGSASGEEPYTLALIWRLELAERFPGLGFELRATDADATMLTRAWAARYPPGNLKSLPAAWRDRAFCRRDGEFELDPLLRRGVLLEPQDIRVASPAGAFDLALCRNLAFTYFDPPLQAEVANRLAASLRRDGALVIGCHERLPVGISGIQPWSEPYRVYRKRSL